MRCLSPSKRGRWESQLIWAFRHCSQVLLQTVVVAVEALALAGLAVAHALHGALDLGVGAVVSGGVVDPGGGLGAGAHGAIVLGPRGVGVLRAGVAGALVVG